MHAHESAALEGSAAEGAEPFGLLKVENLSCFRLLPQLGHSMRSELERTSRS